MKFKQIIREYWIEVFIGAGLILFSNVLEERKCSILGGISCKTSFNWEALGVILILIPIYVLIRNKIKKRKRKK